MVSISGGAPDTHSPTAPGLETGSLLSRTDQVRWVQRGHVSQAKPVQQCPLSWHLTPQDCEPGTLKPPEITMWNLKMKPMLKQPSEYRKKVQGPDVVTEHLAQAIPVASLSSSSLSPNTPCTY